MLKLIGLLIFLPTLVLAGPESKGGGGGSAVACYKGEDLVSVELLDIYEARVKGLTFKNLTGNFSKDAETIAKKMYKNAPQYANALFAQIDALGERIKPIPRDSELEVIYDAWPVFLPRGCKIKQVINYYNFLTLWRDEVLFEKMDYTSQLALAFHEVLYAGERQTGVTDSRYARQIVGLALSDSDPFEFSKDDSTHFCWSQDYKVLLRATSLSTTSNHWKFSFQMLNGHQIFSEKSTEVTMSNSPLSQNNPSDDEGMLYGFEVLESKINPDEMLMIRNDRNGIWLTWNGSEPGDSFKDVEIKCNVR